MPQINYPAKTLMKSSRVVFTMLFGVFISRKSYKIVDYLIVFTMVAGLALFMHADAHSSAVFSTTGVLMLTVSLICDGAITNVSESIMVQYGVGQDEFIFRLYSIALVAITAAAAYHGDLTQGLLWMMVPGTVDEMKLPADQPRTWSVPAKIAVMALFSAMGFFGSSCSAAITKNFGALSMSITSTARKATTLFLSFFLFHNVCTWEHVMGVIVFITALTAKSLRRGKHSSKSQSSRKSSTVKYHSSNMPSLPTDDERASSRNLSPKKAYGAGIWNLNTTRLFDSSQLKRRSASHDGLTANASLSPMEMDASGNSASGSHIV
jgi:solute carrier family 35 (adenosine 3'-phospho 5'-phosphosulfate transporter), member B3